MEICVLFPLVSDFMFYGLFISNTFFYSVLMWMYCVCPYMTAGMWACSLLLSVVWVLRGCVEDHAGTAGDVGCCCYDSSSAPAAEEAEQAACICPIQTALPHSTLSAPESSLSPGTYSELWNVFKELEYFSGILIGVMDKDERNLYLQCSLKHKVKFCLVKCVNFL